MSQLILNGKAQSVTTIVTHTNSKGDLYVFLARPDPRYRDAKGLCLAGEKLKVGSCQFVGGTVEKNSLDFDPRDLSINGLDYLKSQLHTKVIATALRELSEEIHLDVAKFSSADAHCSLVDTVTRDDLHRTQAIHYINIHLGTLSDEALHQLRQDIRPDDDLMQTIHIRADKIKIDGNDNCHLLLSDAVVRTKTDFHGFHEIEDWNTNYSEAEKIARDAGDTVFLERIKSERSSYNRMHVEIRGLQGIDLESLYTDKFIRMFTPDISNIKTDGQILSGLIRQLSRSNTTPHFQKPPLIL